MKPLSGAVVLLISIGIVSCGSHNQNTVAVAKGPYLGQTPPGLTPEIFAPGIVNTEEHREIEGMFAEDMTVFYFVRRLLGEPSSSNELVALEYRNNQWYEAIIRRGESEPSVSPDGKTVYFANEYIERTSEGWSELQTLGGPLEDIPVMRGSVSSNGSYYFDTYTEELDAPLRYSRLVDDEYQQSQSLGAQFSIGTYNAHPFIAPDESYVIWDSRREDGYGSSDLYISYRVDNGSWGPAINMGDKINTADAENYPSVSPDGKFLLFDRRGGEPIDGEKQVDIYWVDAGIIETLRPGSDHQFRNIEGPYMGQEPPGITAEVFAPDVISTDGWELQAVFAPGMREFYYVTDSGKHERPTISELEPTIFGFRFDNNRWHKFTEMPRTGEPFITADGQTMHLAKGRRERTASGWSDVESLGPMFERDDWGIMRLTSSTDGTYVFDDFKNGGVMRVSKVANGERQEPLELPEHINGGEFTAHPFIAHDESYLIWDSEREGGYGESDLYISFRQNDGSWGAAVNMGPGVNSDKDDFYGSVTPDGRFLMFDRTISRTDDYIDVDIYWVDAQIIEDLRNTADHELAR